jgi:hypothetical protein
MQGLIGVDCGEGLSQLLHGKPVLDVNLGLSMAAVAGNGILDLGRFVRKSIM